MAQSRLYGRSSRFSNVQKVDDLPTLHLCKIISRALAHGPEVAPYWPPPDLCKMLPGALASNIQIASQTHGLHSLASRYQPRPAAADEPSYAGGHSHAQSRSLSCQLPTADYASPAETKAPSLATTYGGSPAAFALGAFEGAGSTMAATMPKPVGSAPNRAQRVAARRHVGEWDDSATAITNRFCRGPSHSPRAVLVPGQA